MFGKFLTVALAATALVAVAQDQRMIEGTHGRGVARNANNVAGEFRFEVARVRLPNNTTAVRGAFNLAVAGEPNRPGPRIEMRAGRLEINDNRAVFAGEGVLHIATPDGLRHIRGQVRVNVADNWRPTEGAGDDHPRDALAVRFQPAQGQVWEWGGLVQRGDIVVRPAGAGGN